MPATQPPTRPRRPPTAWRRTPVWRCAATVAERSSAMGAPSSTKRRTKPPGSASVSASSRDCAASSSAPAQVPGERQQNHRLEPFVRPTPVLHLPAEGLQHGQRPRTGSPWAISTRAALSGSSYCPASLSRRSHLALSDEDHDLSGGDLRQPHGEVHLARDSVRLGQRAAAPSTSPRARARRARNTSLRDRAVDRTVVEASQLPARRP